MVRIGHTPAQFNLIWVVPALPLIGALVSTTLGRRLRERAGWLASAAVTGSFAVSVALLLGLLLRSSADRVFVQHLFTWISVGSFQVGVNLRADPLSVVMALVVTGVGLLIHVYSIGYMRGDNRYTRFFAQLNLFVFFMLLLVLADNFLLLFVGWEGVGLCSYLLIGHYFERPAAANAAKKAFIVTRIGDAAMLVGIALIFVHFGSLDFERTIAGARGGWTLYTPLGGAGVGVAAFRDAATPIAFLLLAGAVGKSAQLPLQTWLPDAMEGPTPVSALIHAATMVTAGVYLIVRTHVFFEMSHVALTAVLVIGVVTAIYAATSALAQDDIKRVLAYSTISQIGYMFFAAGLGVYSVAILLLVVHAFYKALLFLSAGSVMHALDGETDLKRMGGLRKAMPLTFAVFVVGWLAIAGVPPLSGFFAKDQVLAAASQSGRVTAWVVALFAAFFSALYISRVVFLAFFGEPRNERAAHESPRVMTIPMLLLAIGAAVAGFLGVSTVSGALPRFLAPVIGTVEESHRGLSSLSLTVISVAVALSGILVGWFVYGSGKIDWVALRARLRPVHSTLSRGWWFDDVYGAAIVTPGKAVSAFSAYVVDRRLIEGAGTGVGRFFMLAANGGRRLQTGFVRTYALAFVMGVVALLAYLAVRF
jgi:NADH-quinone oxidoreductase subunit L